MEMGIFTVYIYNSMIPLPVPGAKIKDSEVYGPSRYKAKMSLSVFFNGIFLFWFSYFTESRYICQSWNCILTGRVLLVYTVLNSVSFINLQSGSYTKSTLFPPVWVPLVRCSHSRPYHIPRTTPSCLPPGFSLIPGTKTSGSLLRHYLEVEIGSVEVKRHDNWIKIWCIYYM